MTSPDERDRRIAVLEEAVLKLSAAIGKLCEGMNGYSENPSVSAHEALKYAASATALVSRTDAPRE